MRTLGNLAVMSGTHGGTHTGCETWFVASFPTHVEEIAELGGDCVNRRRTICGERGARLYGGTTAAEERGGQPCRAGLPRILGLPGDRRSPGVPALRAVHERGRLPSPPADAALRGHHRAAGRAAPGRASLDTCGTAGHLTSPNAPSAKPAAGERCIHPSAWRNCLENSLRHLERASVATRCTRMGTPSTLLGRSRTPIRDLSRISKQFRKGNSGKFTAPAR